MRRRPTGDAPRIVIKNWRDTGHPDGGGSEVYAEQVARGLAADGWAVTFFTSSYDGAPRDEVADGVRVIRRGGRLTLYLWSALYQLFGWLGPHDAVIDVQNGVPFLSNLFTRRPVIVLVHHNHRDQWRIVFGPVLGRMGWFVESVLAPRLYRRCRYVTVSEHSRDGLVSLGVDPERITIVPNGADAGLARAIDPVKSSRPTIIVLGRLVPHKRIEYVLRAARHLRHRYPDLHVDIVGEGYWRRQLRRAAAALEVEDIVDFHGFVDNATKQRLLEEAWVNAVPSVMEGWGIVVMEAATQATPTVAFADAGGVAEAVVDGVTGTLVLDAHGFETALAALLDDGELRARLGRAAQRRSASFSWSATVDLWRRLIRSTMDRPALLDATVDLVVLPEPGDAPRDADDVSEDRALDGTA